jgi:hypothetical protein
VAAAQLIRPASPARGGRRQRSVARRPCSRPVAVALSGSPSRSWSVDRGRPVEYAPSLQIFTEQANTDLHDPRHGRANEDLSTDSGVAVRRRRLRVAAGRANARPTISNASKSSAGRRARCTAKCHRWRHQPDLANRTTASTRSRRLTSANRTRAQGAVGGPITDTPFADWRPCRARRTARIAAS